MDYYYKLALGWAFIAYILYGYIMSYFRNRHYAKEAERLGCKPPVRAPNPVLGGWLFGMEHIYWALRADAKKQFPQFILYRNKQMNWKVHDYNIMNSNHGIVTNDPENLKAILATQFHDFTLGPRRRNIFFPLLGNGIFTADGRLWEHSRALLRPQFVRDQVSDLDLEEKHVQNLMRALPTDSSGWTSQTDLSELFFRLTLDSACEFLFGESVDSQLQELPENAGSDSFGKSRVFAKAFDQGQKKLGERARFFDKYWLSDSLEFRRNCKRCHEFIDHFVHLALNKDLSEKALEDGRSSHDGKERYVFIDALASSLRDPIELRYQLLHILLAGRDTTASLLGWTFYELARHSEIFAKLRASVLEDFGPYQTSTAPPSLPQSAQGHISFSKLKSCTELQHVLNEALRLHPVVPFNFRHADKDTTLPRGGGEDGMSPIFVKKGQQIEYAIYVMHRNPAIWGEDADEFKPERWVGRKPGWEYLPFNGGPRICLGQQFALTEASYVAVRLLQRFDSMQNLDFGELTYNLTLTSSPGDGVKVRLHEAEKA
ncbi:MAG: hypothetical protein MMC23_000867 [Stictis urceolatum]|nr:hypothetical protein [Stictis urceolata]